MNEKQYILLQHELLGICTELMLENVY
jgi:hypothetical protein